ncbi:MAG: hypothetical protein ACTHN5_06175 [Phycisphaerae bacterium]
MRFFGTKSARGREGGRGRASRGSVAIFLVVLLAVVMTGIVSTVALIGGVGSQVSSMTLHRDQAFYAAEAGIQRVYYEVEYGSWNKNGTFNFNGVVGNCTFSVTATGGGYGSSIAVTSVGTYTANPTIQTTIKSTMQVTNLAPAILLGAGISENGKITIDGDTLVKGNINLGGSVTINNGVVQYGGTQNNLPMATYNPSIPTPPSVWFDPTGKLTPPSNIINVNQLIDPSGTYSPQRFNDTSPSSLDFTNHSVLYIVVPGGQTLTLKKTNVYGSGTLVVIGDVSVQAGLGTADAPVNIVATGNVSTVGNLSIVGSIYADGNLQHQGQFQVTGIVNALGSMSPTNGTGAGGATINRAPPPQYDPRAYSGSGSIQIQHFTGPTL